MVFMSWSSEVWCKREEKVGRKGWKKIVFLEHFHLEKTMNSMFDRSNQAHNGSSNRANSSVKSVSRM
jgi:hypothetical protein